MKYVLGLIGRLYIAKERISEFEDRSTEIIQIEHRKQVGGKQNRASKSCGGQYLFNTSVIKVTELDEITGGLVY